MNTTNNKQTQNIKARVYAQILLILALAKNEINNSVIQYIPLPSKGRSGIADMRYVVYIIVAFLIAAILFPIAMTQVTAATTTSWGAGVAPIFVSLLPILVIVAIALHFFGV